MRLACPVLALACLLVVRPLSAQSDRGAAAEPTRAALVEAMKRDLRRLVKVEEAFFDRYRTYTAVLPESDFATIPERHTVIVANGGKGYSATMTTIGAPGLTCGLFHGAGEAPSPLITGAREPACWRVLPDGTIIGE